MRIAILGAGNVGAPLARRLAKAGHAVTLAFARDQAKLDATAAQAGVAAAEPEAAARNAELVVLATPWGASQAALAAAGSLSGRILWDCTNPLKPDFSGLSIGTDNSGGEQVAAWAGAGVRVVKGVPPFAELLARDGPMTLAGGALPGIFVCGDDAAARATVAGLVRDIGAEPTDAGPLVNARFTEPAGMLTIRLAYMQGMGPAISLVLLRG